MINPLVNRMSTPNVNKLLNFTHNHPATGEMVFDELMNNDSWLYLRYDTICVLNDVFNCGFNPTSISELFKSK